MTGWIKRLFARPEPTEVHHHHRHCHPAPGYTEQLDRIERKLGIIIRKEAQQMSKIEDIVTKVREQSTVIDGVGVFIQELRDQIANGATPAQLDEALAGVQGNTDHLKAFTDNTPAATPA